MADREHAALLGGLRVLDLSQTVAGAYCTKLLADGRADVVKVEPADGDPLRRWPAPSAAGSGEGDSAYFRYLAASKRAVRPDAEALAELAAGADVLVEDLGPGAVDVDALRRANERLVVVSISPFGHSGPWADRAGTEFTMQAWGGSIFQRGHPERGPLQAGGHLGSFGAGSFAAVGALVAWRKARRSGIGDHVDVSLLESTYSVHHPYIYLAALIGFVPFGGGDGPFVEVPSVCPSADGHVGFTTITPQQLEGFFTLIERPDLWEDEGLRDAQVRFDRRLELNPVIEAWTTRHTSAEIVERAAELRIPCASVASGADVLDSEHYRARGTFVENPHGFLQPRVPYAIEGVAPRPFGALPSVEDLPGAVDWYERAEAAPAAEGGDADSAAAFSGVRVLDLTSFITGPSATQILAAYGADVIKVESIQRPDGLRFVTSDRGAERWWEFGAVFQLYNRGKRSLTLDLGRDEGRALVLELIAGCDVVIENFTPRVMEQLGLDWEAIHAANPRAILVRMPGFGLEGPWKDRPAFAHTMELVTGMVSITGHADGPPVMPRGPSDQIDALHAVVVTALALEQRDRTGEGMQVELPFVEVILNLAGEVSVERSAHGVTLGRDGNRSRSAAPQGVYDCDGHQRWLALAVEDDAHWDGLKAALGRPSWAEEPSLSTFEGRRAAHDAIDARLAEWCRGRDRDELVELLAGHGVPAAPVLSQQEVPSIAQVEARGFFEELTHPLVGTYPFPTMPYRLASSEEGEPWLPTPAPVLGQHNHEILGDLGLDEDRIRSLEASGVIGDRPVGM